MAAETLRIVRRRKGSLVASAAPRALTAASSPVTDPTQMFKATAIGGRRNNWQNEAWQHYRDVGELHYYVAWRGSCCSKVRLVASEVDPVTGMPTGSISEDNAEGERVADVVRSIAGGPLGQSQLIKRTTEILTVPGELWIAILMIKDGAKTVEKWFAVTRAQIESGTRNNTVTIKLPDCTKHEFNRGNGDGLFRVWNEDAEDASLPDSPVRACLDPLREIQRTTKKIRNADNSRLGNNGILFIPQEASLPPTAAPVSADKPGDPPAQQQQRPTANQLQDLIVAVAKEGSKDPDGMAALVPIVAAAPGDQLKNINHVTFGKDITDVALKTRNDAIARLATGLDVSPERLLGLSTGNHWSAFAIGDDDIQNHIAPVIETICQFIYDSVLRNVLEAEGIDPDKYMLWYDTSKLTADPDKTDEGKDAFINGAITAEAYIRTQGLSEDSLYDLTTLEGCQVWARDAVTKDATLLPMLAPLLGAVAGIDFPQPALPPAAADTTEPDPAEDPSQEPATEGDQPTSENAARDGVSMAVELMVTRALDLAGKRRVKSHDRDQHARLRAVEPHNYHRFMPPAADSDVPGLIKGWDVGLDELAARYGLDSDRVRMVVQQQARKQLTSKVVDA